MSKATLDAVRLSIYSLEKNPHRCALAVENSRFPIELRQLNYYGSGRQKTRRIIFSIRPGTVVVHAIRHAAQAEWRPKIDPSEST